MGEDSTIPPMSGGLQSTKLSPQYSSSPPDICSPNNKHTFTSIPKKTSEMAVATTGTSVALTSPAALSGGRTAPAPHCVGALPMLPPNVASSNRTLKSISYCRKIARDVVAMASGEATTEVTTELPEIVKTIQDAWDKVEDKYAVSTLAVAGSIALWVSTGMISAVDRLPLVPGVLELVGIGYTGWFAYRNLVFKPDREVLIAKIKSTYSDIIGSS